jgi:hypothetical protein
MPTWLVEVSRDQAAQGMSVAFAGTCGLVAPIVVYGGNAVRSRVLHHGQMA